MQVPHNLNIDQFRLVLARRQQAYQKVFQGPQAKIVLADLAQFCREFESTFDPDPRVSANLDGRREVILRIKENLILSTEELMEIKLEESATQQAIVNRSMRDER